MRKSTVLVLILCCSVFLAYSQDIVPYQDDIVSFSIAPISLATFAILNGSEAVDIDNVWMSFSINVGKNKVENDFFFSKYPHVLNFGIEHRHYHKNNLSGFFYGTFLSFDWSSLVLIDGYPSYSTSKYDSGDLYHFVGLRGGGEIGFRFLFGSIGITPKLGLGLPIYYIYGIERNRVEMQDLYFKNMGFNSVFLGLKIDFMQIM